MSLFASSGSPPSGEACISPSRSAKTAKYCSPSSTPCRPKVALTTSAGQSSPGYSWDGKA